MQNTIAHSISLTAAIALTTSFRKNRTPNLAICETFDKTAILALLASVNAASLRIYLGEKEDGKICSVLVAADAKGNDILPVTSANSLVGVDDGLILEDAIRCPELCPPASPLNG